MSKPSQAFGAEFRSKGAIFICRTCINHAEWARAAKLITARNPGTYTCTRCRTRLTVKPKLDPIEGKRNEKL